jgi:hypothetical protein
MSDELSKAVKDKMNVKIDPIIEQLRSRRRNISNLQIQLCSLGMMYNHIQNESDRILVLDLRPIFQLLRSRINPNGKCNTSVPLSIDFIAENKLKIEEYQKWASSMVFKD